MKKSTDLLSRCLEPLSQCLTLESAKRIVRLRADADVESRVAKLAERSSAGSLSPAELAEYELYVRLSTSVAFVQAQAFLKL